MSDVDTAPHNEVGIWRYMDEVGRGQAVPVDLSTLIERIVVSPDFPKWAIGSLQKAVEAAGVGVQVESSGLLDRPHAEFLGPLTATDSVASAN